MHRRDFLALTAAVTVAIPLKSYAAPMDYTPGLVDEKLEQGHTVFLDFKADWCGTCATQERVINALKAENPDYEREIVFINVDWDAYKDDALTTFLNIPRRSTLVALKGKEEIGRLVASTGRDDIKALMDAALGAATSA